MKVGCFALVLVIVLLFNIDSAFAEVEIGTRFLPSKLIENSEGTLQLYLKEDGIILQELIKGLTVTSLDSSIVKVSSIEKNSNDHFIDVTLITKNSGDTELLLAANGFSGMEIPVTVYDSKQTPTGLIVKTIPDTFAVDSIKKGILSVQLIDNDGFPVIAEKDRMITLKVSDSDLVKFPSPNLFIEKDQYFALTEFEITNQDNSDITIYAYGEDLEVAETEISVDKEEENSIELYIIPDTLNTNVASVGHIIVQLQDSSGSPVIAKEDITLNLRIVNSHYSDNVNTSDETYDEINTLNYFQIPKGSYWGTGDFTPPVSLVDTYDITISAVEPLVLETGEITTIDNQNRYDRGIEVELLPILATGNRELIGIVHLLDEADLPTNSENEIEIKINSSDEEFLSVETVKIPKGSNSALIYANVGTTIPEDEIELYPDYAESEILSPTIYGISEDTLELIVEPLISDIISETNFPLVMYFMYDSKIIEITDDLEVFVSPSEYFSIEEKKLKVGETLSIFETNSIKTGTDSLEIDVGKFESIVLLDSISATSSTLEIEASETIFAGKNDVLSIQLLDESNNPVFANKDIDIALVPKDPSMMKIPPNVTIEKGKHFALFEIAPLSGGETEITAITEEFPLSSLELEITSLTPILEIDIPESIYEEESFLATVTAKANGKPLSGLKINWDVDGGMLQLADDKTNQSGEAVISVLGLMEGRITVNAEVTDSWYDVATISKNVRVDKHPLSFTEELFTEEEVKFEKPTIGGIDPILIVAPAILGIVGYKLKMKKKIFTKN